MNRIIIIHDQLANNYTLVSGSNQIQIEEQRKLNNPKKGYSKVLDQKLPYTTTLKPDIGINAELMFTVRCNRTGDWKVTYNEYESLDKLFKQGSRLIKLYFEKVTSRIKSNLVSSNKDPYFIFILLDTIFPEILSLVQEQLDLIKNSFLYLNFELNGNSNVSNILDASLKRNQDALVDAWKKMVEVQLQSAYDPEVELSERIKYYETLRKLQPTPNPPDQADFAQAVNIINQERSNTRRNNRIGVLGDLPLLK